MTRLRRLAAVSREPCSSSLPGSRSRRPRRQRSADRRHSRRATTQPARPGHRRLQLVRRCRAGRMCRRPGFPSWTSWPTTARRCSNPSYASQVTGALGQGLYVMPYVVADPLKVATGADRVHAEGMAGDQRGERRSLCEGRPVPAGRPRPGEPAAGHLRGLLRPYPGEDGDLDRPVHHRREEPDRPCADRVLEPELVAGVHRQHYSGVFSGDPLWIADYGVSSPAIPPGWPGYTFWQSSDSGSVNDIARRRRPRQHAGRPVDHHLRHQRIDPVRDAELARGPAGPPRPAWAAACCFSRSPQPASSAGRPPQSGRTRWRPTRSAPPPPPLL